MKIEYDLDNKCIFINKERFTDCFSIPEYLWTMLSEQDRLEIAIFVYAVNKGICI
jgi:hypothetical protein